jgi:FkbM family methyltransferase
MNAITWLKTYQAAASDVTGESELLTYGDKSSTSAHLLYEGETRNAGCTPIPIRSVRLDDLVEHGELKAPRFVKMDVEGHGHKAVQGMKGTLAKFRPILIVAFHSQQEVDGVLGILGGLGYRWSQIGATSSGDSKMIGNDYLFSA